MIKKKWERPMLRVLTRDECGQERVLAICKNVSVAGNAHPHGGYGWDCEYYHLQSCNSCDQPSTS
jgi:hypothetical protein